MKACDLGFAATGLSARGLKPLGHQAQHWRVRSCADALRLGYAAKQLLQDHAVKRVFCGIDDEQTAPAHPQQRGSVVDGGRIVGVLPLMGCRGLGGGRALISMPYAVYGGSVGVDREVEHALYRAAEQRALELQVRRLELRCLDDPELDLPRSDLYATFIRALPARAEDVPVSYTHLTLPTNREV